MIANIIHDATKGLILGDLNGGPEVRDSEVSADFSGNLLARTFHVNVSPFYAGKQGEIIERGQSAPVF